MAEGRDRLGHWAGMAGFGLGALFDGILLHRILQWHHVSGHPPRAPAGLRWDGLFDAASLALLLVGLAGLWARRDALAAMSGRCITGLVLIGFGAWHLIEGALAHLVLRLHRIRPMAEIPLVWDLVWLVAFGVMPLMVGLALRAAPER